jgi:Mg2+ and Co2+ transporter CorA
MQTIAEKNRRDSASMRVLTIITMIYLPCTIVSNFYSTQFVNQIEVDGRSTKMGYAQNAWVFFAISVPLTVFTFLVWYSWVHMADMRNLVAAQLSAKKKAESPV